MSTNTKPNQDQLYRAEILREYFTPRELIELYMCSKSDYGKVPVAAALGNYPMERRSTR